jgi:hypothetical protein
MVVGIHDVEKSVEVLWWGLFCFEIQCRQRLLLRRRNIPMKSMEEGLRTRLRSSR